MPRSMFLRKLVCLVGLASLLLTLGATPPMAYGVNAVNSGLEAPGKVYLPLVSKDAKSLAEMILIPAGNFRMGCSPNDSICSIWEENETDEKPLHIVYLDSYYIDKYEVTNARYATCVAAGGCTRPQYVKSATRPSYYGNPIYDNYPVINVDWDQAKTFCEWDGKRLPTEAQWEKAARGSIDPPIIYPWGDQAPICSLANHIYWDGSSHYTDCIGDTSAVGSYPLGASPYGVMDMAGNVMEWVNDWYQYDYYGSQLTWNNPLGGIPDFNEPMRLLRGGSWNNYWAFLRTSTRLTNVQSNWANYAGVRCVRSP